MKTTPSQATSQETAATLQLNRSLLPIDEYAVRLGVSRGIVEECGKLGAIQIRKYKGKTYVVDVPLSPYRYPSEGSEGATKSFEATSLGKKISDLSRKVTSKDPVLQGDGRRQASDPRNTAEGHTGPGDGAIETGATSELIEKILRRASRTTGKPVAMSDKEPNRVEKVFEPTQATRSDLGETTAGPLQGGPVARKSGTLSPSFGQIFQKAKQTVSKQVKMAGEKVAEGRSQRELSQTGEDGSIESGYLVGSSPCEDLLSDDLRVQLDSKRTWQLVAIFSIALFLVGLTANIWFYADRQAQRDRLNLAYANIRTVYSDFIEADRQVKAFQTEMADSTAEIKRMQSELDDSRQELQVLRNQLAEAQRNIESIRQRNAQSMDRLHEQIGKLASWVRKSNRGTQPPSSSATSGQ